MSSKVSNLILSVFVYIGIGLFCAILLYHYVKKNNGSTKQEIVENKDNPVNIWGIRIAFTFLVLPAIPLTIIYDEYLQFDWEHDVFYNVKNGDIYALIVRIFGTIVLFIGDYFLFWTLHALGKNWTMVVSKVQDHELVKSGAYRLARHPMYSSVVLFATGLFFSTGIWFLYLMWIINYSFALTRICNEERLLVSEFGDKYIQFMTERGAFCPCTCCDCGIHHECLATQLKVKHSTLPDSDRLQA
eukprot:57747_1